MGKPLVPFLVPPGLQREMILAGKKTATIRVGNRECPEVANLVLFCHIVPWVVMADVVGVRRCTLREVTEQEFKDDGYDGCGGSTAMAQFIANLEPDHPDVGCDSIVTVIRFTRVRGKLVDDWKAAAEKKLENERRNQGLCPKCGADRSDHEVRDFDEVRRDGVVYCKKCNARVRYFDPS